MSYCPFQPPTKYYGIYGEAEEDWQKCGETCALYSVKLQGCVFCKIEDSLGNIAEQLSDIADSFAGHENPTATIFRTMNEIGGDTKAETGAEGQNE